jgi:tetratricopeptide (TPR) repeat protein
MTNWKVPALTIAATALVAASSLTPTAEGSRAGSPQQLQTSSGAAMSGKTGPSGASALFDPRMMAASICRGKAARNALSAAAPQGARVHLASARILQAAQSDGPAMPLLKGLGNLSIKITTSNPLAQRYFDQGLRLAYGFNHADAIRSFKAAQKADRGCAMCYWGEAWSLGPNVNVPMQPEAVQPAAGAMTLARSLAFGASDREQALIAALDRRYARMSPSGQIDPAGIDRAALDGDYADAMAKVRDQFPEDDNIAIVYAEALMNLSPWDYWEDDHRTPKGRSGETIALLESVLDRNPDHAAAIHLYIHMVEASDTPERAEAHADRLGAMMPAAGHMVHMPSHIYIRVGRYIDSVRANQAAMKADEALFEKLNSDGVYPLVYYPHNIHFVMTSAQMAGAAETVMEAARKLDAALPMEAAQAIPLVQPIKAAPIFAVAQFGSPEQILALADPGDSVPYIKAMWHYARGTAFVRLNDMEAAEEEAAAIGDLNAKTDFTPMMEYAVPAPEVLALARQVLLGRIAQADGDYDKAVDSFAAAVEIQSALPYMEPPYWYYPVNQSLGAALLLSGRPDEAERAFKAALFEAPNNGWALFGLGETYKSVGDTQGVTEMARLLKAAWAGDSMNLSLSDL